MGGRTWVGLAAACAVWWAATAAAEAREIVAFDRAPAGVIVIQNSARTLTLTLGDGRAIRYRIAVGRAGKAWTGRTHVAEMVVNPTWQPPAVVRRDMPHLPALVPPGPRNPLGTRALVLGRAEIAIHGTNQPGSIGRAASYGCFRMHNRDVEDLFARVAVGTPVIVTN
jgi:lipoprotein-anchoring transpeptidase ErfK/SrfK